MKPSTIQRSDADILFRGANEKHLRGWGRTIIFLHVQYAGKDFFGRFLYSEIFHLPDFNISWIDK